MCTRVGPDLGIAAEHLLDDTCVGWTTGDVEGDIDVEVRVALNHLDQRDLSSKRRANIHVTTLGMSRSRDIALKKNNPMAKSSGGGEG